jgi:multisubunit Na+/H+ antiporter MnhG subunit
MSSIIMRSFNILLHTIVVLNFIVLYKVFYVHLKALGLVKFPSFMEEQVSSRVRTQVRYFILT